MDAPTVEPSPSGSRWSAEWTHAHQEETDPELVVLLVYEDHLNLLALEEALAARRNELPWAGDECVA